METTTWTNYDVPTQEQVTEYFSEKGIQSQYATLWYKQMCAKRWKSQSGKRVYNWQKYAGFKINDLLKLHGIQEKELKNSAVVNKTLYELSVGIYGMYYNRAKIENNHFTKLVYELISVYKANRGLSEEQTVQAVYSVIKELLRREQEEKLDLCNMFSELEEALLST